MNELKPCPFCGESENVQFVSRKIGIAPVETNFVNVECLQCGVSSRWTHSGREAAESWNRRSENEGGGND